MTKRGFETSWHRLMVMHWIGRVALSAPGHSSLEEPGKMMTAEERLTAERRRWMERCNRGYEEGNNETEAEKKL